MAHTRASMIKSVEGTVEMEEKAGEDKAPLEDSFVEDLDIYGNPKHRFYNDQLERKTKALRDKFEETYKELLAHRAQVDREAFYEAMEELNFGGICKFEVAPTTRLVSHHNHTVEQKEKFKSEHQVPS